MRHTPLAARNADQREVSDKQTLHPRSAPATYCSVRRTWYRELSIVVLVLTFTTLVYATLSIYRLQYFLTLTIVFIVLHQLLAPMKHRKEVQPDQLVYDVYKDKVKAKLE